jgi:autotransporter translocation and assembly factor TamB
MSKVKVVKRISIGLGIGFVLMLILVIGALSYLKTDHARHFLLSQINTAIPGSVSCLKVNFTLSDGSLELRQVSLADPDGKPLASIDALTLDLNVFALLRRELTVTALKINKPQVNLLFDKTGRLGLLNAFPSGAPAQEKKKKSGKLPFNIVINTFELTNGSVNLHKEAVLSGQRPVSVNVQGISLTADGNFDQQQVNLEMQIVSVQTDSAGVKGQIGKIKFTAQTESAKMNQLQADLGLQIGETRIDAAGNKIRLDDIDLTSDALLNLKQATLKHAGLKLGINKGHLLINGIDIPLGDNQAALKSAAVFDPESIRLNEFTVVAGGCQLAVTGSVQAPLATPLLGLNVAMTAELEKVRDFIKLPIQLTGSSQLDMAIRGSLNNPEINLQLVYNGGVIAGYHIDAADLDCALQDFQFDIRHLNIKKEASTVNLAGCVDLRDFFADGLMAPKSNQSGEVETIAYDLALDAGGPENPIDLAQLMAGNKAVQGLINAAISIKGQGVTPAFINAETAIKLDARQLTLKQDGAPIDLNVKTDAHFKRQILRIASLKVLGNEFSLDTQGRWDTSSGELDATIALDAADLMKNLAPLGLKQISGGVKLDADISGTVSQPAFKVALAGKAVSAYNFTIGDLILDAELDKNGLLKIALTDISNQDSSLQVAGSVQLFKDAFVLSSEMPSSLEIKLSNIALNDFFPSPVFHGRIDGTINTQGNLNDLQTQVSLHGRHFGYDVYRADDLFLDGRVEGSIKKPYFPQTVLKADVLDLGVQKLREVKIVGDVDLGKVIIHQLDIVPTVGENIHASGLIDYKGGFKIDLLSGPIDLAHIDALSRQDIVSGKVVLDIEGQGKFSDPDIKANLQFTEMLIKEKPLDDFQLHLGLQDHLAQVNGQLNFDINASYHLQQKTFQAQLAFDQTDLEPYFKLADQPDLNGMITGRIQVQGKADAIDQIQGKAAFTDIRLGFKQPDMIVSHDLQVNFEDSSVVIPGSTLTILDKGRLKVQGRGRIGADVALRVEGEFPIEMINHFTDALPDAQGNLLILAEADGAMTQPDIRAEVDLENIGFTIPGLMQRIRSLNGRIKATTDTVTIDHISGQMDKGRFNLDGQIDLDKFKPVRVDLTLNANALPIHIPDMLDINLNTDLHFQGTPDKSALAGELVILDGTYYQDVNLSLLKMANSARQKKRQITPKRPLITQPFVKNMALDIAVKRRNPFVVDNNLAYLEINPNLDVTGTPDQPVISGRAEVESGDITFHEKKFEIKRGIIEFLNPYKIEPTIDLQSEVLIRNWTVSLNVKGPPDELRFTLTSDPPEEQSDLLTLILTGQTAKELSQSGGKGSTLSGEMAAAYLGKSLGDDISKMAGLDTFEVQTKGQGTEDDPETVTVTVGKELSARMGVSVNMESKGGKSVERGEIEYKLLENFKAKGFQDSQGAIGGELFFRYEFR